MGWTTPAGGSWDSEGRTRADPAWRSSWGTTTVGLGGGVPEGFLGLAAGWSCRGARVSAGLCGDGWDERGVGGVQSGKSEWMVREGGHG